MTFKSVNLFDGSTLCEVDSFTPADVDAALFEAEQAIAGWVATPIEERSLLFQRAAAVLREHAEDYARLMTLEMGKPIKEARAEIEKSA